MNNCLNCGKEVKNKYCGVSCQNTHQGIIKANTRYGFIKDFEVSCGVCKNNFLVYEREKLFPKRTIYYCSRSCSNKRIHTIESKQKITNSLFNFHKSKNKVKNSECIVCNNFFVNKTKKKTCSVECRKKLNKINGSIGGKKSSINKKQFDDDSITYIYALTDEFGNIKYIGKSNSVDKRYKRHLIESKKKRTHKEKWISSMLEKGIKPGYFILEECVFSDWILMEEFWISQAKSWGFNLTNGTSGGEGSNGFKGKKHSEETKQKLKETMLYKHKNKLFKPYTINRFVKLKDQDVIDIREKFNGYNLKELSSLYNMNSNYLKKIIDYKKRIL